MCRVVNLRERLKVEMRVHLRTRNRCVAEHLLHRAQIARRLQDMRCERMAQHVRMNVTRQTLLDRPRREATLDRARRETSAVSADEQSGFVGSSKGFAYGKPGFDGAACRTADRHDS